MNCLIVDDEVLAQDVLALYISRVDSLKLVGRCSNALQAFAALNKEQVDIMFLDIKMPEMSGLDLIKSLKHPPRIILTTAFEGYALEGYELDIIDYLLKPIRFERFLKAVDKAQLRMAQTANAAATPMDRTFYVRSDRKLMQIDSQEVRYIESMKNYLCIYTERQKIIVHSTLANIAAELQPNRYFVQVHRSFIVNTRFIAEVDNSIIHLKDKSELPVGGNYKDNLLRTIRIVNS